MMEDEEEDDAKEVPSCWCLCCCWARRAAAASRTAAAVLVACGRIASTISIRSSLWLLRLSSGLENKSSMTATEAAARVRSLRSSSMKFSSLDASNCNRRIIFSVADNLRTLDNRLVAFSILVRPRVSEVSTREAMPSSTSPCRLRRSHRSRVATRVVVVVVVVAALLGYESDISSAVSSLLLPFPLVSLSSSTMVAIACPCNRKRGPAIASGLVRETLSARDSTRASLRSTSPKASSACCW
mmetsp:Transcript_24499/g.57914  ORF Transcript_24499/g.57914 Transcript_24499/m.57914 type:complete len:242 (-) Transcript_24499:181-906(-)